MKKKVKVPASSVEPAEASDTVRHTILSALEAGPRSARDISADVRIPERDVYRHLEHIRKTVNKQGRHLVVNPAECKKCGFLFAKREKLSRPGKCPLCQSESIREPRFSIQDNVKIPAQKNS